MEGDAGLIFDGGIADAGALDAGDSRWTWVPVPESACGSGTPTGVGLNVSNRSQDVFIYLQGGGACWSSASCAVSAANLDGYDDAKFLRDSTLSAAPFVRSSPINPFKDMSYVFVPYCTGDVHAGDSVRMYPAQGSVPGRTVFHKGGKNMQLVLPLLKAQFPDARRVFLVGSSAGAFGAQLNYERVADTWPQAEVHLLADCGQLVNPTGALLTQWLDAWNITLPQQCSGCLMDFPRFPKYLHDSHPNRRFGLLGYTQDSTLRQFAGLDAATYQQRTLDLAASAYDTTSNAKYFIVAGTSHVMFRNPNIQAADGTTLLEWTTAFVNGDASWLSVKPQ
jgi:Pectinacetylesterase